ncbi:hypothetical protein [Pseudoalteromonas sp. KAN5]|uniref:hypothetical protein n=1 Tax=Pseudoalteromonas sp. KAN5 TaxID=2916633 RepID=UPI001FCA9E2E|nr:hypothetical protein [Pseudoalteromonas sp. KAN5]BDF96486.1 hypothetical protein KAN5_33240 [Pseudoalteromonas sp. KAN5]
MPTLEVTTNNYINSTHYQRKHYELLYKQNGYIRDYLRTLTDLIEYASYSGAYKRPTAYFIRITPSSLMNSEQYTQITKKLTKYLASGNPLYFAKAESNTTQDGLHFHMVLVVDRDSCSPERVNSALNMLLRAGLITSHAVSAGSDHRLNLMYPLNWKGLKDINKTSVELYSTKTKPSLIDNAVYLAAYLAKVDTSVTRADIGFQPTRTNFKASMKNTIKRAA